MTFGEHLEELRKSLGKALLWLAVGLVFGLVFFADRVVRYVQEPLKDAIQQFNTDRDLARLGVDPNSPDVAPLSECLNVTQDPHADRELVAHLTTLADVAAE